MTGQIDEIPMEQGTVGRKSKRGRKPWKKRMRNVVLSPLHLFQKYVLRKKRHRRRKKSTETLEMDEVAKAAAVETALKRKLPCYFLFLGLSQSGKSTTISKLFNTKRPQSTPSHIDLIEIYQNPDVGDGVGLKIVDTPGFSGENEEEDCQITCALSSFLRQDIPCRVPTATFLVAPLDDDAAAQSKFDSMMKTFSHLKKSVTDEHHSNLILLLTHSQKLEQTRKESEIAKIIQSYKTSLSSLFPSAKNPIPVIQIENFRYSKGKGKSRGVNVGRYHDIIFEGLRKFAVKREEYILHHVIDWLSESSKRFSVPLKKESVPMSRYLPGIGLYDNSAYFGSLPYRPYFVLYDRDCDQNENKSRKSTKHNSSNKRHRTCIPVGSQLVLANKKVINIEDCVVGDKLLSLDFRPSVVTKIRQTNMDEVGDAIVGTIYCSLEKETEGNEKIKLIYKYENGSFATVNLTKANIPEKASANTVYFIEIDLSDGTFVFNGFPCFVSFVQCDN